MIIWNFPHAGFPDEEIGAHFEWDFEPHVKLISQFLDEASKITKKVVISHKTILPFSNWKIPEIAEERGYILEETIPFDPKCYPGYINRKGQGKNGAKRFPSSDAVTYILIKI